MKKSTMKSIRNFLIFALVVQLILPVPLLAAAVGEFTLVTGDVTLIRKGRPIKPNVKTAVETKDVITTGKKAMAKIVLTDGSELTIAQKSKFEIKDFSLQKEKRRAQFSLFLGKLRSQVKKRIGTGSLFQVNTPTAVAGVRGSEFISLVEAQQEATQSTFYAVEESLTVYNPELAAQVVTVDAGQYTVVAAGVAPTAPAAFSPAVLQSIMGDLVSQAPTAVTTAAAAEAGTTAGTATAAGTVAGTVAAGVAAAAAVAAGVAVSTGSTTTTGHHTTTAH
ncbi:MAG: FecR family protein [Deltaproteobacteria bacterium]|nr:FecR family protein [Deltaproteobacteria bacterium]